MDDNFWVVLISRVCVCVCVCVCVSYQGYEEGVFEAERGSDGEHGVQAAQQSAEQDQLADVRLHRQVGQVHAQRGQVLRMVQSILTHTHTHKHTHTYTNTHKTRATVNVHSNGHFPRVSSDCGEHY